MKKSLHKISIVAALISTTALTQADTITELPRTFTVNQEITDPQDPPQVFLGSISDSAILSLTKVEVQLNLTGTPADNGFASDMYVSLNYDFGPTSILLNRVGITDSDSVGYFYDGWDVTFSDDAIDGDIHGVDTDTGLGILTGTYQPDGRINPTDTARPSLLDVFSGSTGNGDWRLAVGDLSPGGQMQLQSWSITLTGTTAVPEPGSMALIGLSGFGLLVWRKRLNAK
jgi:hypothetical protein